MKQKTATRIYITKEGRYWVAKVEGYPIGMGVDKKMLVDEMKSVGQHLESYKESCILYVYTTRGLLERALTYGLKK